MKIIFFLPFGVIRFARVFWKHKKCTKVQEEKQNLQIYQEYFSCISVYLCVSEPLWFLKYTQNHEDRQDLRDKYSIIVRSEFTPIIPGLNYE